MDKETAKQRQNILTLYIGLFISTVFNFIPNYNVQIFGFILFFVLLIACYVYRARSSEGTLQNSHAQYLIKSIWTFSLFLFIGVVLSMLLADNSAIHNIIDQAMSGIMTSEKELEIILAGYMKNNILLFCAVIAPSFIYFFYRLYKGAMLAKNNTPIINLRSWF